MSVVKVGPSYLTHAGLPLDVTRHVNDLRRQETLRTMNDGDLTATRLIALLNNGVRDAEALMTMGARNLGSLSPLLEPRFFRCDSITPFDEPEIGLAPAPANFHPGPVHAQNEAQYVQTAQHVAVADVNELVGQYFQMSYYSAPTLVYWYAYMMPNTDVKISVTQIYKPNVPYAGYKFFFQGQMYRIDGRFF
jgi:hypothetical protein